MHILSRKHNFRMAEHIDSYSSDKGGLFDKRHLHIVPNAAPLKVQILLIPFDGSPKLYQQPTLDLHIQILQVS